MNNSNILNWFKLNQPKFSIDELKHIKKFDELSSRHVESPEDCQAFGKQIGYNNALDFYKEHGIIPELNHTTIVLDHWQKYIEFGKVKGHNQAVKVLIRQENNL